MATTKSTARKTARIVRKTGRRSPSRHRAPQDDARWARTARKTARTARSTGRRLAPTARKTGRKVARTARKTGTQDGTHGSQDTYIALS